MAISFFEFVSNDYPVVIEDTSFAVYNALKAFCRLAEEQINQGRTFLALGAVIAKDCFVDVAEVSEIGKSCKVTGARVYLKADKLIVDGERCVFISVNVSHGEDIDDENSWPLIEKIAAFYDIEHNNKKLEFIASLVARHKSKTYYVMAVAEMLKELSLRKLEKIKNITCKEKQVKWDVSTYNDEISHAVKGMRSCPIWAIVEAARFLFDIRNGDNHLEQSKNKKNNIDEPIVGFKLF